jgi:hypothetical protein
MRRFLDEHGMDHDLLRLHECHVEFDLVAPARYVGRAGGHVLRRALSSARSRRLS